MAIEGICRISTARIAAIAMFLLLIASEGAAVLAIFANVSPQPAISNQAPPPNIETIIPQAVEFNFSTGNRIWDGCKPNENSLTYTWNPMSFYGFYYNVDDDVGTESLTVIMSAYDSRTIGERELVYSTNASEVSFEHGEWGKYNVIGFMADKYFAGYTANTNFTGGETFNTLNSRQIHKVLMDSDDIYTMYPGSSLTLKEGYVLRIKDVDVTGAKTVLFSLFKDGSEVDTTAVTAGNDYIYSKKVGNVSDLPVIAVHVDTLFVGKEANTAFVKGIFHLSGAYTSVTSGKVYDAMNITTVGGDRIEMKNDNSISLFSNSIVDIMGNVKFKVADSGCVRFAPMVQTTEPYEARGIIATGTDIPFTWTPMNFEGFYYNIDDDAGTETLDVRSLSGRNIPAGSLVYTSTPRPVSFEHEQWGKYTGVGFMGEKYFAGYENSGIKTTPVTISAINSKQLHKILLDDDEKYSVYEGSSLTFKEGYVLRITDVDITGGRTVVLSLFKDGNEVNTAAVNAGNTYAFEKSVGNVSDLPIIAVSIDSVFVGREVNAAFIRGIFQLSENYDSAAAGVNYGIMEVKNISANGITMENDGAVELSAGSTIYIMGKMKFRVADDSANLRYYPFVLMNSITTLTVSASGGSDFTGIQDAIDNANAGDTILVYSGAYYENVDVNKHLTLIGIDSGGSKPLINANGSGSGVTLSAGQIILEGFNITNSRGWPDAGIKVNSNNNIIRSNTIFNNDYGILTGPSGSDMLNRAYQHLAEVMDKYHKSFDVYTDAGAAGNHFVHRAFMGTGVAIDDASNETVYSGTAAIKNTFSAQGSNWGGVYFQNGVLLSTDEKPKDNWGDYPDAGYDLTGATELTFRARGANGGEKVEFFAFGAGRNPESGDPAGPYPDSEAKVTLCGRLVSPCYITLENSWKAYTFNLTGLNLSYVIGGFGWVTDSDQNNNHDITFYLDDISYNKPHRNDLRFLVSYETIPSTIDFDKQLGNVAFTYDNALALIAFTSAGDWDRAKLLADAFVYAQEHDRYYTDGRLRNAYQAGDLVSPPGWTPNGRVGTVRMPGLWDAQEQKWFENEGFVGSGTGNMAWVMIALLNYYEKRGGDQYLTAAATLGDWIEASTRDARGSWGGYSGGYTGREPNITGMPWKSTEHNLDLYVTFERLYLITGNSTWHERALYAKGFVDSMWNPDSGHFWTGTLDDGVTINNNPQAIPLDAQTWSLLAFGENERTRNAIDFAGNNHRVAYGNYVGFDFNTDRDMPWFEGTAQMAAAYWVMGNLSGAQYFVEELREVQLTAPNGNGRGIVAAPADGLTTGFDWLYFNRLHVGATAWYVFAEQQFNPYWQTTPFGDNTMSPGNNVIYNNNFINNTHQAYDYSNNNSWDSGYKSGGNYWDNYGGIDSSRDGIGDTPYNISGSRGAQDRFPLMNPVGTPPTWNVFQNGTVVEISYGSGRNFPQYAALHIDSGYFRLVAPDTTWGTSVILLPSFWENGTYYQGARVTYEWYVDGPDLVLLLRGNISNLAANIKMRIFPPAGDAIQAAVEGNVTGNAEIDKRSGEAFKPVMLSSMHISSGFWDSQSAYSNSTEFSIPDEGWIVWPPVNSSLFGLKGGSSGWKTNAATVEIQLDKSFEITGWVTKSSNPDDDNVGFWAASGDIVSNWNYTIVARKKPVNIPFPGLYAFPTDPDGDGLYEDINGNDRKDFNDVVVFFNNLEWVPDNEPVSWFDFNGNGRIDFADIVSLFEEI